jgi:hypothetical protein
MTLDLEDQYGDTPFLLLPDPFYIHELYMKPLYLITRLHAGFLIVLHT